MSSTILFIDSTVKNYKTLLAGLGNDVEVHLLNAKDDGIWQIAHTLRGRSGLDSIQILSHGSSGALALGSGVLNSDNLGDYADALNQIGSSLSDTGDILLYGCNVAQGETGIAFVDQFAALTGADVAASDDLTGNSGAGGDSQLEYHTDTIETSGMSFSNYNHSLATTSNNFAFSADNILIAGLHYEKELYHFGPDVSNYALGLTYGAGKIYTNASLDTDFALKFKADLGSLQANVAYPIQVNATVPSMVKAGDFAIIDTSNYKIDGASVVGDFTLAGAGITLSSSVDLALDGIWAGIPILGISEKLSDIKYDPAAYNADINIARVDFSGSQITLSSDALDSPISTTELPKYEFFGGLATISAGIPGEIKGTTDTDKNTAGDQTLTAQSQLSAVTALGTGDTALVGLNLDLAKIVEWGINKLPNPAAKAFSFSAALPADDPATPINEYDASDYGVKATLFEASLDAGIKLANQWTFIPNDVAVSMTSTLGETYTGYLGDSFAFHTPSTGTGTFDVNAAYTLSGKLISQFGVVLSLELNWDALNAEFKAPGLTGNLNLVPASLKEAIPLYTSEPLLISEGFETPVNNLGSNNATYTVHYSQDYTTTNPGAYYTTIGTPFEDYLSDNGTSENFLGFAGNDKIYANGGDDTINAGDGNDVIKAGNGNDTINISGISGTDSLDGNAGSDTLNLDWSKATANEQERHIVFMLQKADNTWLKFGDTNGATGATIDNLLTAFASSPVQYAYQNRYYNSGYSSSDSNSFSVTWSGMEKINVKGSDGGSTSSWLAAGNDFIVYQNGQTYAGGGGWDQFFANWSSWTESVILTNDVNATNSGLSDGTNSIIGSTHQVSLSGMERLLLLTGSGNDTIVQNVLGTHDEFRLGDGNDTLTLAKNDNSNDYAGLGAGNDAVNINGISGTDSLDGNAGSDTLNLDWSKATGGEQERHIVFMLQKADNTWLKFGDTNGATGATIDNLLTAFASSPVQYAYQNRYYNSGYSSSDSNSFSVTWSGMEKINVKGSDGGSTSYWLAAGNDFIVYQNGQTYAGGGGWDQFFADFSSWDEDVNWTNTGTTTAVTLGLSHQVSVSGMERLLLLTGNGNDTIVQNVTGTNDEFRLGNGNNKLTEAVNDNSNDYILLGTGDDEVSFNGISGTDTVIAAAGTDTLNLDWSKATGGEQERHIVFMLQKADNTWLKFGDTVGATGATIDNLLTAFASSPVQYAYQNRYYNSGYSSSDSNSFSVTWSGIEKINVKGSDGGSTNGAFAPGNDFIIYQNGQTYAGGGGWDQFFANWSSWTESVILTNDVNATNSGLSDGTNSIIGSTHQVSLSGMERLLLLTGSGDDTIIQNVLGTHDEFRLGDGNDTLTLAKNDNSNDYAALGTGNDVVNISGISGTDSLDGNAGSDTLNLDWSKATGGEQERHMVFMLQKADNTWLKFGDTYGATGATIDNLLTAFASSPVQYAYQNRYYNSVYNDSNSFSVTWSDMEKINVKGSDGGSTTSYLAPGNDFIVYQNGQTYAGGGGWDQFFADFSSWDEDVNWTNTGTTTAVTLGLSHQVSVSGMERLLLLTGSGNDSIVQNVTGTNDEFRLGAGDDSANGNSGNRVVLTK